MITTTELPRSFYCDDIARFFDDAEDMIVASWIGADGAQLALGYVETDGAEADPFLDGDYGPRQPIRLIGVYFENVKRDALSGLGTYTGQSTQGIDQVLNG